MTYTDVHPDTGRTIIATTWSRDGVDWRTPTALAVGKAATSDSYETSELVVRGGRTLMYASRYDDGGVHDGFPASLYAFEVKQRGATALSQQPVLERTPGWYDNDAIYSPAVIRHGGEFVMAYVGHAYTDTSAIAGGGVFLLGATSTDGVHWDKMDRPLVAPRDAPAFARHGLAEPELVVGPDGTVHLFFTGLDGDERVIGYARAQTPFGRFEFADEPIVAARGAQVLAPNAVLDGNDVKLWYSRHDADGTYRIMRADGELPATGGARATDATRPGSARADTLSGGRGDDVLKGRQGDDHLAGEAGRDTLDGGRDHDALFGGGWSDVLIGGSGRDTLVGGNGIDHIDGGSGEDTISGGAGDDVLTGGAGADTVRVSAAGGDDTVLDFDPYVDALALDPAARAVRAVEVRSSAAGLVVDLGAGEITLAGLTRADLPAGWLPFA